MIAKSTRPFPQKITLEQKVATGFAHGGIAFFIYGAFGLLAAFVVMRFVPETKGVDSDQVAALWRRESYDSFTLDSAT